MSTRYLAQDFIIKMYCSRYLVLCLWSARRGATVAGRSGSARLAPRIDPAGIAAAKAAGVLCGKAGTSEVVDATVVIMALALRAVVWTTYPQDIAALADKSGR
jgi:hypothetical protein